MTTSSILILIAFLALVTSPYFLRRFSRATTDSYGAFAIGARNFGWFRICAGLSATFVGGAAVINLAGLGYSFGWYGLADVLPTSVALERNGSQINSARASFSTEYAFRSSVSATNADSQSMRSSSSITPAM